jgi:hypothetical protein
MQDGKLPSGGPSDTRSLINLTSIDPVCTRFLKDSGFVGPVTPIQKPELRPKLSAPDTDSDLRP